MHLLQAADPLVELWSDRIKLMQEVDVSPPYLVGSFNPAAGGGGSTEWVWTDFVLPTVLIHLIERWNMSEGFDEKQAEKVAQAMEADPTDPMTGTAEDQSDMTRIGKKQELLVITPRSF